MLIAVITGDIIASRKLEDQDKWLVPSAELVQVILHKPQITQEEVGKKLGIKQSGVSRRWNRANVHEILEVNRMFQKK
ncbi:MAG: hypothetical protein GX126_18010 [Bacteroidales bacterium]|jgi:DNA-binding transcriptional regulator LsrR (DeoR family)|nr:hypothetical protein [Bacteroidales bacterium]